jgi:hypothetical protein
MADNLQPSNADVTESGCLKLPEPSGPHRPVMGLFYFYQLEVKIYAAKISVNFELTRKN